MKTRHMRNALLLAALGAAMPLAAVGAEGDWILRAGAALLDPKEDNLSLPAGEVQVDDATSATLEAVYMFADRWGVELSTAYPFTHDIAIDGISGDVGETKLFPTTLSMQYHFNPEGTFRPYLGVGLNYSHLYDTDSGGALAGTDLDLDDSWGPAAQLGADIGLGRNWLVNLGVRWIGIESDLDVGGAGAGDVEIDPLMYQLGVGYRFGKAPVVAAAAPVAAAVAAPPPAPPPPPPPKDSDGDGVVDASDQCPDTPRGDRVGPQGCTCDVVRQVQFALNSAELTAEGRKTLDEVAETLTRLKFVAGTVIGHTDSSGSDAYNQKLSERRAQAVADYLQGKGIASGRLAASGAGESQPIADNATKEGRAENRRVVLKRTDCDK